MIKLQDSSLFRTENFVNGAWVSGSAGHIEVFNPANGDMVARIVDANADDTRVAVEAAASAFKSWSRMPAKERAAYLHRWYELILENADDLGGGHRRG